MFETLYSWLPSFRRNQVNGPSTQGYAPRQNSWRHPSIPPYPEDGFTKMQPPVPAEIPPPPLRTPEERVNFLMERLPDQGSEEANAALRARVVDLQERSLPMQREYEAGLQRLLGHRLDDPRQNILEYNHLMRALQNATPEEIEAFGEHAERTLSPLIAQTTELLSSLSPETLVPFINAGLELQARELAHIPPSYNEIFPLPRYDEIQPPLYGEHATDELLTPERAAQLPESAFTRRAPETMESLLSEDAEHPFTETVEAETPAHPAVAEVEEHAEVAAPARSRWRLPSFNWRRSAPPEPVVPGHYMPGGWRREFDPPVHPTYDDLRHDMPGSWRPEFDGPAPPAETHPPAEVERYDMPGSWRPEFDLPPAEPLRHDMPGSWRPEFDEPAAVKADFAASIKEGLADLVSRLRP